MQQKELSNGNFNFNSGFNGDGSDLLDNFRRRVQVNQALVNLHLKLVKGFGTVTTRRLTGSDAKNLGGKANGTLYLELLIFGTLNKIRGNCKLHISMSLWSKKKKSYPFPNSWHCEKTRWYGCGGSYYAYICLESFDHLILPLSLLGLFLFFKARLFSSVLSLHYWWLLLRIIQLYL